MPSKSPSPSPSSNSVPNPATIFGQSSHDGSSGGVHSDHNNNNSSSIVNTSVNNSSGNSSAKDNIQVVCRVRPMNSREVAENSTRCLTVVHDSCKIGDKIFTYNQVFGENAKQQDIFQATGVPVIDGVFQGFNGTIFAYGQTGSGKTHTMMGPDIDSNADTDLRGIIPRSIDIIFNRIGALDDMECSVHVSFFEIYNERVNDLLNPKNKNIDMRNINTEWEDILTHKTVNGLPKALQLLTQGLSNRKTGSTDMNAVSSRSHSIFVISIKQTNVITKTSLMSKLYLVDLAGSEKQKKTRSTGDRFKEGTNINKSLFVLSRVISALTEGNFVPYRDSVLTKVLKHSLGGNCKTALVINVSPSSFNEAETLSTLQFGANAKKIKNDPRVNMMDDNSEVAELKSLVETQRLQISEMKKQIDQLLGRDLLNQSLNDSILSTSDFDLNTSIADGSAPSTIPAGCCNKCLKELESEEKELNGRYAELKANVRNLIRKCQKMQDTQLVYNKRVKDLEGLEKEIKKIKSQVEAHQQLIKKHSDLTESIKKYENELPKLVKLEKRGETQYQELKSKFDKEEMEYQELKQKWEHYNSEIEIMKKDLENQESTKLKLDKEIIALLGTISEQTKKKERLKQEENDISQTILRSEALNKEKQELELKSKNMIVKVSKENERLADQLRALSRELTATNEKHVSLKNSLQQQELANILLQESYTTLCSERDDLISKKQDINSEIARYQDALATLAMKKEETLSAIETEKVIIEEMEMRMVQIRETIKAHKKELDDLKPEEEKMMKEVEAIRVEVSELEKNKRALLNEREQIAASIPDLEVQITLKRSEEMTSRQELEKIQKENADLIVARNILMDSLQDAEKASEEYKRILLAAEYDIAHRKVDVERVKKELEQQVEQKKYYECQHGIIKIQIDSLNHKISDLSYQKVHLEEVISNLLGEISYMNNQFQDHLAERDRLSVEVKELSVVLESMTKDKEIHSVEYAELLKRSTESQSALDASRNQLAEMKQELSVVKAEFERKKAQLHNLTGQCTSHSEQLEAITEKNDSLRKSIEELELDNKDLAERLRLEREQIAKEKQKHFEKLMEDENKRREMEQRYREDILSKAMQDRKQQDEVIASEVGEYNSRMEQALKDIQQEMRSKLSLITSQSQEFERKILAITRRKKEIHAEFQLLNQRSLLETSFPQKSQEAPESQKVDPTREHLFVPKTRLSTGGFDKLIL